MLIGVPAFRLPREAIEMDVRLVERLGVTFLLRHDDRQGHHVRAAPGASSTPSRSRAGAMDAVALDIPGAELEGVQYGVDFMKKANLGQPLEVGNDVVVIGGGYTAMDCSRTSLRHGAENVTIAYRRTRSELVVDEEELGETEREGVRMEFLASPIEILGEDGKVSAVKFIRNRLGEPDATGRRSPVPIEGSEFIVPAQTVIPAVTQAADHTFLPVEASFEINRGRVKVDPATYATNVKGVFACGDFVTGPTTLIEAAGHGKKAAYAIDRYLAGRTDVSVAANVKVTSSWRHDMPEFYDVLPRQHVPMVQLDARMPSTDPVVNFNTPVELGYDANGAVAESTRCLMCNYNIWFDPFRCVLCGACADVCPEGVIHMIDINQLKSEGPLPELVEAYGWEKGGAMVLDEERCIRCALCVKRCPYDAITMERFELQEISTDGRLYKESYRDAQLAGDPRRRRRSPVSFLERMDQTIRRSAAWRSLFRQPYPRDERSRAYAVMNNVFLHIHPVRVRQHAVKFAYTFCLGGLSFFLFLVLTITGVYLMFFYVPSATLAYTNILDIQSQVPFGLLTRNIHRWGAHLMVFFVFLHMMRVFYHGAYKPPREFNWVVGVVLLFLTIMLSFTGYLLPWDQIAYWAITIGTNMAGYAPLFNTPVSRILLGGIEVGQNTLLRFYVLHVMVLPLVAAIFLAVHFWRIRKDGGITGPL